MNNFKFIWMLMFLFNNYYFNYIIMKLSNLYWFSGELFITTYFSFNKLSPLLFIMTIWMLIMMYLMKNNNQVNIYLTLLTLLLMLIFISKNLIIFFFFFEFSLMPMFILLKKWGNYMERMNASFYLLIYTLFFSFPFLLMLMNFYKNLFTLEYNLMFYKFMFLKMNIFEIMFITLTFLVKMPMFLMHFWLPKAHVEAPVFGSMYLACIMLKLGSFGLMRMMFMFKFIDKNLIMSISLIGMILISLNCLKMIDMKIIVAYSSVIHMNMMISSMFTYSLTSFMSSYMMMIAHGLISSGMFFMINEFYLNSKSRLFKLNKGLLNLTPKTQLLWFFLCTSNMAIPLSLNFISEMFMLISLISFLKYLMILFFLIILLNSFLNLNLFMYISHSMKNNKIKLINFKMNNMMIIMMHWLPINFIFLKMNLFYI